MIRLFMFLLLAYGCVERDVPADLPAKQEAALGPAYIIIETEPDGTGIEVEAVTFASDDAPVTYYAIARDLQGFFVSNAEPVTWSLSGAIGNITTTATSVTFAPGGAGTGTITADHAFLDDDLTGQLQVVSGAGNRVSIETAADGSGTELTTETIVRGGATQTFYAVIRDASNNFVGNTESVTWSLSNPAVGTLLNSMGTSVQFDPTTFGTTILTATSTNFSDDSTGLLTIGVGPGVKLSIEDRADGTGTAPVVFNLIESGLSQTVYAIVRDEGDNFVSNSVIANWSNTFTNVTSLSSSSGTSVTINPLAQGSSVLTAQATGYTSDIIESVAVQPGVSKLASSGNFTCVLRTDAVVKCWGRNNSGQLGQGNTTDLGDNIGEMGANLNNVNLGNVGFPVDIKVGLDHACALFNNGLLKCWGENSFGQLGLGNVQSRGDNLGEMNNALPFVNLGNGRTVKEFDLFHRHTCAILDDDGLKCWGNNSNGQLGTGDAISIGDNPLEIGSGIPYIDLGTGRTAKKVATGETHTCAILDDNSLKCWGGNATGQLGLGDMVDRGDDPGEMGDALTAVDIGNRTAIDIKAGNSHTCVLLSDNNALCFGLNSSGQLAIGNNSTRGDDGFEVGNNYEQMKVGAGRSVSSLSTGVSHTCAVLDNGQLKCFGLNSAGQLGAGNILNIGDDPLEVNDLVIPIDLGTGLLARSVSAGLNKTCVLLNSAQVKCFGDGQFGVLGQENVFDLGDGPGEMGDALPIVAID